MRRSVTTAVVTTDPDGSASVDYVRWELDHDRHTRTIKLDVNVDLLESINPMHLAEHLAKLPDALKRKVILIAADDEGNRWCHRHGLTNNDVYGVSYPSDARGIDSSTEVYAIGTWATSVRARELHAHLAGRGFTIVDLS